MRTVMRTIVSFSWLDKTTFKTALLDRLEQGLWQKYRDGALAAKDRCAGLLEVAPVGSTTAIEFALADGITPAGLAQVLAALTDCWDAIGVGDALTYDVAALLLPRKTPDVTLDFARLREANVARCEAVFHKLDSWSESDWGVAMGGEAGEALNLIKKRRRAQDALPMGAIDPAGGAAPSDAELMEEIADVIIYCDLLAARVGGDLGEAVRAKFNKVSGKRGSTIKL